MGASRCEGKCGQEGRAERYEAGASGHEQGQVQTQVTNEQTEYMYEAGGGDMSLPPTYNY